jgi:hypothetical protein
MSAFNVFVAREWARLTAEISAPSPFETWIRVAFSVQHSDDIGVFAGGTTMHRDIRSELAEFVGNQGYAGAVTVIVPRSLAQRLIDGYPWINSDVQTADDVGKIEPERHGLLDVTFELGNGLDDQIHIRTADGATFPVTLPPLYHVGIW